VAAIVSAIAAEGGVWREPWQITAASPQELADVRAEPCK